MRHGIADRDWPMILDMIAAGFGLRGVDLDVVEFEVLARRQETRLRFNAPTPVESWEIRLQVRLPKAEFRGGEALLFHWVVDGEWELVELDF